MHPLSFLENPYFPPHVTYAWFIIAMLALSIAVDQASAWLRRRMT